MAGRAIKGADSALLASFALVACSAINPEIESFVKSLQVNAVGLKLNDSLLLKIPGQQANESLVLINGQYRGRLCSESNMNKDLESQVSKYSSMTAPAFALVIRNEKVVEGFPLKYSLTLPHRVSGDEWCAVEIDEMVHSLRLRCVEVGAAEGSGVMCSRVSIEIESR